MRLLLVGTGRACLPDFTCGLVSLHIFGISFGVSRLVAVYLEKTTPSVSHLLCCTYVCSLHPRSLAERISQGISKSDPKNAARIFLSKIIQFFIVFQCKSRRFQLPGPGRCPCPRQGGQNQMILKVPSIPNHSRILFHSNNIPSEGTPSLSPLPSLDNQSAVPTTGSAQLLQHPKHPEVTTCDTGHSHGADTTL